MRNRAAQSRFALEHLGACDFQHSESRSGTREFPLDA
jgi:hypothetical protein